MHNVSQIYSLVFPQLKWLGILSIICASAGCNDKSELPKKEVQAQQVEQPVATESDKPQIKFTIETLDVKQFICEGAACPDVKIQRLSSNFPELDTVVDRYIYGYMAAFLQGFDVPTQVEADQNTEGEASSPLQDVQRNKAEAQIQVDDQQLKQQPKDTLLQQIQPSLIKFMALAEEVKSLGSSSKMSLYIKPQVLNPNGPISTVVINSNNFIGGAHGSSAQHYINFDLEQQKVLNLETIIQDNKRQDLNALAYKKFQAWVVEGQPNTDLKLYENLWRFSLSNNFYLAPQGLILQYGEYEIGPYVVGLPRLVVSYEELKDILKPQYLPEKYVNQNIDSSTAK